MRATTESTTKTKQPSDAAMGNSVMTSSLRCLEVLELLSIDPNEFGLAEVSRRLDLAKGTAHRLVSTLVQAGFVEQDESTRRYKLSAKALWVGAGYLRHSQLYRSGFSVIQDLARKVECMVHLAVPDGDTVMYLHTVGHPTSLYLFADTGERRAMHATALGKAMLAFQPAAAVERLFSTPRKKYTDKTIVTLERMKKELAAIRAQGYSFDDEEGVRGLFCVAAPIFNQKNEVAGAISVSSPRSAATEDQISLRTMLVREAAMRISVHLGFRPVTTNLDSLVSSGARKQGALRG